LSIDGTKALLTEHPFSAVPLSRVIGPRKRPVLAAPPPQVQIPGDMVPLGSSEQT